MFGRPLVLRALTAGALLLGASAAHATTLTVDGDASDWGFLVADNNGSTFVPDGGLNLVGLFAEDSDDNAEDDGFVGPNYGGQNYDGEVLAAAIQATDLYLVMVTGQRPDNGFDAFGPGDLRIATSGGDYGIEIGGGPGGGAGGMLVGGEAGSTYTLDSNGFTTAHSAADPSQVVGSIWLNPSWLLDPIPPQAQTQMQIGGGGTYVGNATYRYTRDTSTTQHAVIELSIPLSLFGGQTIESIWWTPSCGNDELSLDTHIVPEPSSLALALFAGIAGLAARNCRRAQSQRCRSRSIWNNPANALS